MSSVQWSIINPSATITANSNQNSYRRIRWFVSIFRIPKPLSIHLFSTGFSSCHSIPPHHHFLNFLPTTPIPSRMDLCLLFNLHRPPLHPQSSPCSIYFHTSPHGTRRFPARDVIFPSCYDSQMSLEKQSWWWAKGGGQQNSHLPGIYDIHADVPLPPNSSLPV